MDNNTLVKVETIQALESINRTEIDMQVATAKKYPRDMEKAIKDIKYIACLNPTTAEQCFYSVPRGNKQIQGISVRFAEIVLSCWGNLRVQTRIIGGDNKSVIVQGMCHDLETNSAVCQEVKRRITDKQGNMYSDDMITTTTQAASSIALRNAIFRIVPMAILETIADEVKAKSLNSIQPEEVPTIAAKMIEVFKGKGIDESLVLNYLNVKKREDITREHIYMMRTINNAIREGTVTMKEVFFDNVVNNNMGEQIIEESKEALSMVEQAMQEGK